MIELAWQSAGLFAGMLALFGVLTTAMTLLTRRIGEQRLRRWLGGSSFTAPLKGLAAGAITPFCSWSTIPVLVSLVRSRVPTATVAAFYLASPVLDPVLLVVLALLFGLPTAVGYGLVVTLVTVAAAVLAERSHIERHVRHSVVGQSNGSRKPTSPLDVEAAGDCRAGWPTETPWQGWRSETGGAVAAARSQASHLLPPLAIASLLAVLVASQAPRDVVIGVAGNDQPTAVPAAALVGIPLYLPTETLAPLGWALRDAGVGTGAILALLVTAAGLSMPEFTLLASVVRVRLVVALVGVVAVTALGAGYLIPLLLSA